MDTRFGHAGSMLYAAQHYGGGDNPLASGMLQHAITGSSSVKKLFAPEPPAKKTKTKKRKMIGKR